MCPAAAPHPKGQLSLSSRPTRRRSGRVCAYHETVKHLAVYPDGSATALRAVIGHTYALNPALIVCGAGSNELLNLLAQAFPGPGDEAIHTVHGFLVFRTDVVGQTAAVTHAGSWLVRCALTIGDGLSGSVVDVDGGEITNDGSGAVGAC
jgi:histidinol-phosphate/aromatic aminotransferase/cobyric acid decarboxylase-like protein